MDPQKLFKHNLESIKEAIGIICCRRKIYGEEKEELASLVQYKLIENNYKIIRAFKGKSSFKTYIVAVINRIFLDRKREDAGRWRPSEKTKKMGEAAVMLEELLYRQNYSLNEAYEILTINHNFPLSLDQVQDLSQKLPKRPQRLTIQFGGAGLENIPSRKQPLDELISKDALKASEKLDDIIKKLGNELTGEDRLILRMKFEDDLNISEISRAMKRERHYIDRRIKDVLKKFREEILAVGVNMEDIRSLMERDVF